MCLIRDMFIHHQYQNKRRKVYPEGRHALAAWVCLWSGDSRHEGSRRALRWDGSSGAGKPGQPGRWRERGHEVPTEILPLSMPRPWGTRRGRAALQVGAQQRAARTGVGSCWHRRDLQSRGCGDCQPLLLASNTSFCNWLHKMSHWSTGRGNIPSPCTLRLGPAEWEGAWAWGSACFQVGASSRSALGGRVMGTLWAPSPEHVPRDEWCPFPPSTQSPVCCSCCFLSLTERWSMAARSGGITGRTDGWCLAACRISDQMGCSSQLVSQILQAWRQFDTLTTSEPYAPIFLSMAGVQSYLWL